MALVAAVSGVRADVFTVTFDELYSGGDYIGSFYDGGSSGSGIGPGPSYGLTFDAGAYAVGDYYTGSGAAFINGPSQPKAAADDDDHMTIDSSVGITNGIYLYYVSPFVTDASLTVYDGLDGTGSVLATVPLPQTPPPNGQQLVDSWPSVSVPFSGTAYSIVLTADGGLMGYDSITFGSPDAPAQVPEPCTPGLLAMGLVGLAAKRRRKV